MAVNQYTPAVVINNHSTPTIVASYPPLLMVHIVPDPNHERTIQVGSSCTDVHGHSPKLWRVQHQKWTQRVVLSADQWGIDNLTTISNHVVS